MSVMQNAVRQRPVLGVRILLGVAVFPHQPLGGQHPLNAGGAPRMDP
jgi:hypothetical protein